MQEDRRPGIFTANVGSDTTKVWMRDSEGNYFELDNKGSCNQIIATKEHQIDEEDPEDRPVSPDVDGEFIDEESRHLPPPTEVYPPRIFIVRPDGTGSEFMNEKQLEYYFRIKAKLAAKKKEARKE